MLTTQIKHVENGNVSIHFIFQMFTSILLESCSTHAPTGTMSLFLAEIRVFCVFIYVFIYKDIQTKDIQTKEFGTFYGQLKI